MRRLWCVALVIAGCSTSYGAAPDDPVDASDSGSDASSDARISPDGEVIVPGVDAAPEAAADAGDSGAERPPFQTSLVLRFETDAPNGLGLDGAWRDLSKRQHAVTIAAGSPSVSSSGAAGAKAMVFGQGGPIFDVADTDDLRFGATDDFLVVARATIEVPLGADSSCTFAYFFAKYAADDATGAQLRVCAPNTGRDLIGSLRVGLTDAKVAVPQASVGPAFHVMSFGRNQNGTRIETYVGGASVEVTLPAPIDVSSVGSPFVVGGRRFGGTGGPSGSYVGRVNRVYVYHAPAGTFSTPDFDIIRTFVKSTAPLP